MSAEEQPSLKSRFLKYLGGAVLAGGSGLAGYYKIKGGIRSRYPQLRGHIDGFPNAVAGLGALY
jgi:hypothetical protein